jgi:NAD(P)-dependent dehydrogenase (short-subunit alcohol dehydrogenase family)
MSLAGKSVVVTGSTRGIGRAIAEAVAAEGAHVYVSSRNTDAVEATVAALAASGASVAGAACDVAEYAQVEALRDRAFARFGTIDAWVNNAGISEGYRPLDELEYEELRDIVAINLLGHMYGARAILPHFRERGGVLMNMAGRGYRGEATPHTAAYTATKAAIASLTRSLAAESKDSKATVVGFVPGMVATDFYRDIKTSPRLASTADNWRYALDAFGVPLEEVGRGAAKVLGTEPHPKNGEIYSMLGGMRTARGIAKIIYYRASGKMTSGD